MNSHSRMISPEFLEALDTGILSGLTVLLRSSQVGARSFPKLRRLTYQPPKPTLTKAFAENHINTTEDFIMSKLISCEYNIDTACVELLFADGIMISIDCIAVENEIADNRFDRAELDWLTYNKPLEYADLVLNGGIEKYCKSSHEHSTIED